MGFVAHIPHYLAQMEYPQAAVVLLEQLEIGGRLTIDLTDVRAAADITETEIASYLESHDDVGEVVHGLEQQYDAFRDAESAGSSLLAADEPMPTGEEIGQQFEQFLAGLDQRDDDGQEADGGLGRPSSSSCWSSRTSTSTCSAAGRPTTSRQRVFGGQVAAPGRGGRDSLGRGRHGDALDALLLPAPRRHGRADHLRRRAHPGRPLLRDPAGDGAPARPSDLLHDRQLPGARGRPRPPGPDARRAAARDGRLDDRHRAARTAPSPLEEWEREWAALDVRYVGTSSMGLPADPDHPARAQLWLRTGGPLGDDPVLHLGAFTYATDLTLLGAALTPHGIHINSSRMKAASLDHSIWFHRPFRADEWWLYDQVSPIAHGGRGLAIGRVFTQDGTLVATVAQEGLIRVRPRDLSAGL